MVEKYDQIGGHYNNTRKADSFIVDRLYRYLNPRERGKYLDIGCGTGNYTIALNERGVNYVGVDPSIEMLKKARERTRTVEWIIGRSEKLPIDDVSVDGVTATLTIHHWDNLDQAFRELLRVLKPFRRIVIFTSTSPQMKGYWLNHYFPKILEESTKQMPTFGIIEASMKKAGFKIIESEKYFVQPDLEDLFLYSGKYDPSRYLNKDFRKGISTFTNMASRTELETGLRNLARDVESEKVWEVIERYSNNRGDYLFLVGEKRETPPE